MVRVWTSAQQQNHLQIAEVDRFFAPMSDANVLKYCFNLNRDRYPEASALAASALVVYIDTEGWDADSQRLKELGMAVLEARDMTPLTSAGPYGENIIKNLTFYFVRIQENSHLRNKNLSADMLQFTLTANAC